MGAREPRRRPATATRPPVGRQRPRRLEPPCTTRSSPCAAPTTTEDDGEAYGFSLVYSGNFIAEAEVDPFDTTRVRLGISPNTFTWTLEPGATFATPEAVLVYSDAGLGAMSDALHGLYRERLARGHVARQAAAGPAQQLGGDLLRVRRGEAARDRDRGARPRRRAVRPRRRLVRRARRRRPSLGDWFVDRRKLPDGLDGAGRQGRGARAQVRPVDRARDDQRAEPPVRGAPGLGRSASPAGRGPRAASSSSSTCRGPRSSTTSSACCRRSWRAPRSRTSSGT